MNDLFIKRLQEIEVLKDYEFLILSSRYPSYKKRDGEKIHTIGCGDLITSKIPSIGSHIIFTPIEQFLQEVESNWKADWNPTIRQYNHTLLTGNSFGDEIYSQMPIEIANEQNIIRGTKLIEEFVRNDAEPFFRYWNNITNLLPWLEGDFEDYKSMNKLFGNNGLFKKSIVWHLTNHPQSKLFINHHSNRLSALLKENGDNESIKSATLKFENLRNKLQKSEPLYEWNPKYLSIGK